MAVDRAKAQEVDDDSKRAKAMATIAALLLSLLNAIGSQVFNWNKIKLLDAGLPESLFIYD